MSLISYTLPCHKREADLRATLPMVIAAANVSPPIEILVTDYGHPVALEAVVAPYQQTCASGVSLRVVRTPQPFFKMGHARNIGLRAAQGEIACLYLADQFVTLAFFPFIRNQLAANPEALLTWYETFVGLRQPLVELGGFDERFEFYGPEGKDLADRWQRAGGRLIKIPPGFVDQRPTPYRDKVRHYRIKASRRDMHYMGMAVWEQNQAEGVIVANAGQEWGRV